MSIVYLKVKIKSLAEEAKIIRHEERKAKTSRSYRREAKRLLRLGIATKMTKGQETDFRDLTNAERDEFTRRAQPPSTEALALHSGLQSHRKNEVRREARAAQLAYAFLRGVPYAVVEAQPNKIPGVLMERVVKMIGRFDGTYKRLGEIEVAVERWLLGQNSAAQETKQVAAE